MNGHGHSVVTASDGVKTSYYGQPVIKAPHWRWLVIGYLFCGGIAGASYTIGSLAEFFSKDRGLVRAARYVSFAALIPCPALLILDLGRPDRFMNMLRIVKLKSPMSLGSWTLAIFSVFSTIEAGIQIVSDISGREWLRPQRRLLAVLGMPFSIFLSGYTGVLLAATNIPLWWRASPLLAPTFISSAYSSSFAAISLFLGFGSGEREESARRVARAETACMAAELGLMTALLVRTARIGRPLRTGKIGSFFWPITYVGGIIAPLILHLSGPIQGRAGSRSRRNATAIMTLLGGFSLRAAMVLAGRKSAEIPEDYFAMTSTPPER